MKKLFALVYCLYFMGRVTAQDEKLSPLRSNPTLYNATKQYQDPRNSLLVDKGIYVITTDTLKLPFIDDFSTNQLRGYKWLETHVTATVTNVFGTCLNAQGVPTIEGHFIRETAWHYVYDTVNDQLDSFPLQPVQLTFYGPAPYDCFTQTPQVLDYWLPYYRPDSINTETGQFLDSVLVNLPSPSLKHIDTIFYAPVIYFSKGQPGTLWVDNYAYVNRTLAINPPTIGVATLDGLNEYGLPYNSLSSSSYGIADHLTSKPIDLSEADTSSVYLSFFYEAGGLGDFPDSEDSLVVEFRDAGGSWTKVWPDSAFHYNTLDAGKFKQQLIRVPAPVGPRSFFYNTFQFRFVNYASLFGNNDHWHIDYVKLDQHRNAGDTAVLDIAFVNDFPSILKNYTELPANLFTGNADLKDSLILQVHNLSPNADNNPPATNFGTDAVELYPIPAMVANNQGQTFNAASNNIIRINPAAEYNILPNHTTAWPVDSLVLVSSAAIQPNDSRPTNDTVRHTQNFNFIMAYDDGSAERAYGLSGLGTKKFAYEFDLAHPDTLAGFQIMYSQVEANVGDLVFNFYGWDSLRMNDFLFVDAPIISKENAKPLYVDSVNGFTTYILDTPVIISGKFYLGWAQSDTRNLQIGYDLNTTLGRPHMFIFTSGSWKPSAISPDGSPMLRLILDGNYSGHSTGVFVNDLTKENNHIDLFPIPTTGLVNLRSEMRNALFDLTVLNMMGQAVYYEKAAQDHFDISAAPNGIYLVSAKDTRTGKVYHAKVVKTAH